jgi:hypothetical protein
LGALLLAAIVVAIVLILVLRKRRGSEAPDGEDSDEHVEGVAETMGTFALNDHYVSQEAPSDGGRRDVVVAAPGTVPDES